MNEIKLTTQIVKIISVKQNTISYKKYGLNAIKLHFTSDSNLHNNLIENEYYIVVTHNNNNRWHWQSIQQIQLGEVYNTIGD